MASVDPDFTGRTVRHRADGACDEKERNGTELRPWILPFARMTGGRRVGGAGDDYERHSDGLRRRAPGACGSGPSRSSDKCFYWDGFLGSAFGFVSDLASDF